MRLRKSLQSLRPLAGILSPLLFSFTGFLPPLLAQSNPEWQVSVVFPPTTDRGAPERTAGGGTRGNLCVKKNETPLTALMPINNVGTTASPHPTFFLYVPTTGAKVAEFTLLDEAGEQVYQTTVALTGSPGVIKLGIPENKSLKVGEMYQWEFAIVCDPQDRERDELIWGWSERVELNPALQARIEQAVPLEQAKLYAKNQIWHETIAILAKVRRSNPAEWEELLKSVELDAIASAPFVDCCTVQNQPTSELRGQGSGVRD